MWEHFTKVTVSGKTLAQCKKCGHQQAGKAQRLISHHAKCSLDDSSPATPTPVSQKRQRSQSPPRKRQAVAAPEIDRHIVKTNGYTKSTLDSEIC